MTADLHELLTLRIAGEGDVLLARQRGREVAALAGLENQDQVRVATALSELSRQFAMHDRPVTITLATTERPAHALRVTAHWAGQLPAEGAGARNGEGAVAEGLTAAARLMDDCTVNSSEDGGSVVLTKCLPAGAERIDAARAAQVREAFRRSRPVDTLEWLGRQNRDLLETLESLQARREDLLRANAELEETNRGVVALYAELDEATTRLREASESKTRFWASVSHELRSPLNSVLGLTRLLLDEDSDPLTVAQRHQVELVRDSGAMLLALVNDLLDVAKAESGLQEAQLEPTDLCAVFDQARASLRPTLTTPEVALVVEDPRGIGPLSSDPVLLGRILRNLLSNAVKFTERGEVRCLARVAPSGEEIDIVVADSGIGIALEHQQRVFEEFFQVPGLLQARVGGTGLGLPYARRLAELLGGALTMESERGRGTTMTLRLPRGVLPGSSIRFGSVLIVDDDPLFRAALRRALGSCADRVSEVRDGAEALSALRASAPDLVLLDLDIPSPHGLEVLSEMREDPALGKVAVVVVTAARIDAARRAAIGASAGLLDKAHLSADTLMAAVMSAVETAAAVVDPR